MKSQQEHKIDQQINQNIAKQMKSQETVVVQPQTYQIGFAQLSREIKKRQNLRLFNGIVIGILENQNLSVSRLDEDKINKWKRIFSFTKKTLATRFQYQSTYNSNILKEIKLIDFPNLKEMNLYSSAIQNYEFFTFLQIPCLQYLNIIYNNSPNFKAFNTMNLPSLKVLCIYIRRRNLIEGTGYVNCDFSIQDFERWGFNLNELRLEKADYDVITMQDLSKLAKSKPSLNKVYYCRLNRINQQKAMRHLTDGKNINFHFFEQAQNQNHLQQFINELDI